ncbi:circularly permuted type 2 ATP-grasp protein [Haliangium sp.]|uniref:circularly permuted type 2 ATP-grasp protein n=1 Tax=Haliangium sp. TaxID=2663208 RepID=UPI003D0A6747
MSTPTPATDELSIFPGYEPLPGTYDEVFAGPGRPRPEVAAVIAELERLGAREMTRRRHLANGAFLRSGITFTVYGEHQGGIERIFPFDLIPRVIDAATWDTVDRGLRQRVHALDAFLADVYGDQRILAEGVVPRELVEGSAGYLPALRGIRPTGGVYAHISGIDLIRTPEGAFVVLEDNARTPSGVSYVIENRAVMKRALAEVFARTPVRAVDQYPTRLRDALTELAPADASEDSAEGTTTDAALTPADDGGPLVVVLTPGRFNSAYFEHSFLARRMGCPLVEASDLFVHDDKVWVKTTAGPRRVHVIYRRIDDDFIDPEVFRPDSLLGVPGLVRAYARGGVTLANALGNGVADDKAIYPYVPEMIRFYLSEEPILGQVETLVCGRDDDRRRVLANLGRMVVKAVDASGGYGMLIGPKASRAELDDFAGRIHENPRGYIAQPLIELSTCPTWVDDALVPRRVDLRPYIVRGRSTWVLPGGLSRVALVEGSYVVNSSQGGGSKDTWVMEEVGS